jgi:hypothetical protein
VCLRAEDYCLSEGKKVRIPKGQVHKNLSTSLRLDNNTTEGRMGEMSTFHGGMLLSILQNHTEPSATAAYCPVFQNFHTHFEGSSKNGDGVISAL